MASLVKWWRVGTQSGPTQQTYGAIGCYQQNINFLVKKIHLKGSSKNKSILQKAIVMLMTASNKTCDQNRKEIHISKDMKKVLKSVFQSLTEK